MSLNGILLSALEKIHDESYIHKVEQAIGDYYDSTVKITISGEKLFLNFQGEYEEFIQRTISYDILKNFLDCPRLHSKISNISLNLNQENYFEICLKV